MALKMYKTLFVLAGLIGLVNQLVLNGALTDWIADNAEEYWFWGVWILVWLLWVIGDKLLKALASNGADTLRALDEVNYNLEQIRQEIKWSSVDTQMSPTQSLQVKESVEEQAGPWEAEGRRTAAPERRNKDKTRTKKASNDVSDLNLPRRKAKRAWLQMDGPFFITILIAAVLIFLVTYS